MTVTGRKAVSYTHLLGLQDPARPEEVHEQVRRHPVDARSDGQGAVSYTHLDKISEFMEGLPEWLQEHPRYGYLIVAGILLLWLVGIVLSLIHIYGWR